MGRGTVGGAGGHEGLRKQNHRQNEDWSSRIWCLETSVEYLSGLDKLPIAVFYNCASPHYLLCNTSSRISNLILLSTLDHGQKVSSEVRTSELQYARILRRSENAVKSMAMAHMVPDPSGPATLGLSIEQF